MKKELIRFRDELYTRTTGKFKNGRTEIDLLSNKAVVSIFRRRAEMLTKKNGYPDLTEDQKKEVREYYKGCPEFSMIYHSVYTARRGIFDPAYMPDELYYGYIEPYYVDREAARYIDNKTYYYRYFDGFNLPDLVAKRVGSLWFDGDEKPIKNSDVPKLVEKADTELVLKKAENTGGGVGIYFLDKDDPVKDLKEKIRLISCDVVIQKAVVQHEVFAKLHPQSVNTLRIMTFLKNDGVEVLGTAMRIGDGDSRMDNAATGGFFVGITDENKTGPFGVYGSAGGGTNLTHHPSLGYKIEGIELPGIDKAKEMAKQMHLRVPKSRIISWDIAIDSAGEPVLIETNLALGGIDTFQVCTGPIFGNDTKRICREVFGMK